MLTFWGDRHSFCDRVSRRDFLRVGTLGLGGLTLADLLRLRAQGKPPVRSKSVIMVYLEGGPSHIDMYDLKPNAPEGFRGEFKPIQTNVPGFDICEHMPLQARIADKMALIRSMRFEGFHGHHAPEVLTGFVHSITADARERANFKKPAIGSVVSWLRRGQVEAMPPYVALDNYSYPGFLGKAHQPFVPGTNESPLNLTADVSSQRLRGRQDLQNSLDDVQRALDSNRGAIAGWDAFSKQALEMVTSAKAREAFDVDREPDKVRDRYGRGKDLLLARRLVEAGVPLVQVTFRASKLLDDGCTEKHFIEGGWDSHYYNFKLLRQVLPRYDQAIYALVTDLCERGLDRHVTVVVWGEMGRMPKIGPDGLTEPGAESGRSHWTQSGFALVTGGGLKMGQVIGATEPLARYPTTTPYTPQNVLATLYHVLGIDPETTMIHDLEGRPMHLLEDRKPVKELL